MSDSGSTTMTPPLLLAITGATGCHAARILAGLSPWPVALLSSAHGRQVYALECEPPEALGRRVAAVYADDDLAAPAASGSVPSRGMVVLPCTTNTLAAIASGRADTLITRAAHCHLKERRPLILCVRETPWTQIDFDNAARVTAAGGIVMPLSPPYYMFAGRPAQEVSMHELLTSYVERVLRLLGHATGRTWEDVR